jgi:hypothetical protein
MTLSKSTSHRTPAKREPQPQASAKPSRPKSVEARTEGVTQERTTAPVQEKPNGASAKTPEEIRAMISDLAYMRAQARNFEPGHELDDWIAAEGEIKERLERGR